jgi:hypothetical protein
MKFFNPKLTDEEYATDIEEIETEVEDSDSDTPDTGEKIDGITPAIGLVL